jgi:predicted  nucleic acid-binding Zn-ribbon protein
MSQIPKDTQSKYNKDNKFRWVDSQLEKLMNKQKELEDEIANLTGKIKNDMDYIRMLEGSVEDLKEELIKAREHTPTDGLEVGNPEDYEIDPQLNLFNENFCDNEYI